MKNRKILLCLALLLSLAMATTGTIAYLQDTDSAVNVMTLGNVYIEQIEEQLTADGLATEPFDQNKPFYPGTDISKIVSVKNTGKTEAYFRTLIAFEDIDSETFTFTFPINEFDYTWSWGAPAATIVVDGSTYVVYEALYKGVLPAGETSPASLTKVEMGVSATNEDMEALGGAYEILVLSQAVQTAGFSSAKEALDQAFGEVNEENAAKWFDGMLPLTYANNAEELAAAIASDAPYIELTKDITISSDWVPYGDDEAGIFFTGTLNGKGYTVTMDLDTTDKTNVFTALIGAVKGGTVKNLVVEGEVKGNNYTASVVGYMEGGVIENVVNNATISGKRAAGIGSWILDANVVDCVNNGDITAADRAAGICGNLSGSMTNCKNTGDVTNTGSMPAGGMVAVLSGEAAFNNCVNTGDVHTTASGDNASAAGILGQTPSAKATIMYCVNTGDITADGSYAAGIVYSLYGNDTSSYCYNSGDVYGAKAAGGIAPKPAYGTNSNANYCLNAGAVTGGKVYNTANKHTGSFYYAGDALYDCEGAAAEENAALATLNGGADSTFFHIVGNKIESALK